MSISNTNPKKKIGQRPPALSTVKNMVSQLMVVAKELEERVKKHFHNLPLSHAPTKQLENIGVFVFYRIDFNSIFFPYAPASVETLKLFFLMNTKWKGGRHLLLAAMLYFLLFSSPPLLLSSSSLLFSSSPLLLFSSSPLLLSSSQKNISVLLLLITQ